MNQGLRRGTAQALMPVKLRNKVVLGRPDRASEKKSLEVRLPEAVEKPREASAQSQFGGS